MPSDRRPHPNERGPARDDTTTLARGLGMASVGLGLPSLLAPATVSRLMGLRATTGTEAVLRGIGVQEMALGAGLLRRPRSTALQWARVLGDAAHLTLLGRALTEDDDDRPRLLAATAAVAGITVVDLIAALRLSRRRAGHRKPLRATRSITVRKPAEEVYRHWRALENLPAFMWHLESVVEREEVGRSHWVARAPGRRSVRWDAEIVEDRPGQRLAWRSVEGSSVPNRGSVTFAPAPLDQGTEVHVELEYDPPGGRLGIAVATLLGESPDQQIADDLRRFKQVLETGEVLRSDGTPEGSLTRRLATQRPAQPAGSTTEKGSRS